MTTQDRQQLLSLVDALCEGVASADDCARLERLVLSSHAACQLYVQAIGLHGSLYWDAAGVGDLEQVLEADLTYMQRSPEHSAQEIRTIQAGKPNPFRPRTTRAAAWLTALSACLLVGLLVQFGMQPEVASGPADIEIVATERAELNAREAAPEIPQLKLPGDRSRVPTEIPVVNSMIEPPEFDLPQPSLVSVINLELASGWQMNGVVANPVATDAEWFRRVYLDLAGRIPTMEEAERFLSDAATDKRARQLTRLLDGEEFPVHLAGVWTNLLVGRTSQAEFNRSALEQFLANQFAANRPWSETVTELVTAEGSGDENGAANFLLAHLNNEAVPATAITARVLLGHQMQCTQCHQHPAVAGWGQEQFWEMNACFQQTRVVERLLVDQETGEQTRIRELIDEPGTAGSYYETLKGVIKVAYPGYGGQEIPLSPETRRRQALAELMLSGKTTDVARAFVNRMWAHFFGYGFTSPIDDLGPHNPISHPELLDALTQQFVSSGYNVRELVTAICESDAYQLSSAVPADVVTDHPENGSQPLFSRAYVKHMSPEQMFHSLLIASGVSPVELRRTGVHAARKEAWLSQFFKLEETEENGESSTFDGSLPQALSLMNGDLVREAVQAESGSFVSKVVDNSDSDVEKIRKLCLATLSRYPTNEELSSLRHVMRSYIRQRADGNVSARMAASEGYRDLYWAYLNSSEFGVIH